jgi:hypothetical protein
MMEIIKTMRVEKYLSNARDRELASLSLITLYT